MVFKYKLQKIIISVLHGIPNSIQDQVLTDRIIEEFNKILDEEIKNTKSVKVDNNTMMNFRYARLGLLEELKEVVNETEKKNKK